MNNFSVGKARRKLFQRSSHFGDGFPDALVRHDRNIVFGEINACLEDRNQLNQALFRFLQPPRERPSQLLCRHLDLIQRLRVNQVAHRFCLGQIDASVQERPRGEFARLRQSRPARHAHLDHVLQHHWRSVRRNLNHVVRGVGMRPGEVSDHDFVNARRCRYWQRLRGGSRLRLSGRAMLAFLSPPINQFPKHCPARLQFMHQLQHGRGDLPRA